MTSTTIRKECLVAADCGWAQPTTEEIREVLRLAQFTEAEAARALGINSGGGRVMRRWVSKETDIPYAAWALLCNFAGLGEIWLDRNESL